MALGTDLAPNTAPSSYPTVSARVSPAEIKASVSRAVLPPRGCGGEATSRPLRLVAEFIPWVVGLRSPFLAGDQLGVAFNF